MTSRLPGLLIKRFAPVFLCGWVLWTACHKEPSVSLPATGAMTNEEIIALLEGALAEDAGGLQAELVAAGRITHLLTGEQKEGTHCGFTRDTALQRIFNSARFSGTQAGNALWLLNCEGAGTPQSLGYSWSHRTSYESPRMISDEFSDGTFTLTNVMAGKVFRFHGSFERTGTQKSKVREPLTFETSLTISFADLAVDNAALRIERGEADFQLSGSTVQGQTFGINGTIIFSGSGTAGVVLGGTRYSIRLN